MLGFGATGQFAIGEVGAGTVEFIGPDKWLEAFSEPLRFRSGLGALEQQATANFPIQTIISWYDWLGEPVRLPRGIAPQLQQFSAYQTDILTVRPFAWYANLTEPIRLKIGLGPQLQQFFTIDAKAIRTGDTFLEGWYNTFSEPVRFKQGINSTLQQYFAYHPRLLPNPNVTAILRAVETNSDTAIWAINVIQSKPAASAKVSFMEIFGGQSATSVREQ